MWIKLQGKKGKMGKRVALINLARVGDVVSIIPVAYKLHQEGNIVDFYCHTHFCDILSLCSYINVIPWDGLHRDVSGAIKHAKNTGKYDEIYPTQVDGNSAQPPVNTENFILKQWSYAGERFLKNFHKLPLIFDNRNREKEREVLNKWLPDNGDNRPILIYSFTSHSSGFTLSGESRPFYNKMIVDYPKFLEEFKNYRILNIGLDGQPSSNGFKLESPKYLLPLLEKASILLCVDSLPIHLTYATNTPTIVFSVKNKWYQSEPRQHWITRYTYEEACNKSTMDQITEILGRTSSPKKFITGTLTRDVSKQHHRNILHGISWFDAGEPTNNRVLRARATWEARRIEDKYYDLCFIEDSNLGRTAKNIGDIADLPFLHDLFDILAKKAKSDTIIMFTNSDIFITNDALSVIRKKMDDMECCFSFRKDVPRLDRAFTSQELSKINSYAGADLFCFTKKWWKQNKEIFPDLLLGREGFDWVLRRIMLNEYPSCEITTPIIYHELHPTQWCKLPFLVNNPGQIWNRNLCRKWAIKNNFSNCLNLDPSRPLFKADKDVQWN